MNKYNPDQAPEPEAWNALGEIEQMILVKKYHEQKHIELPNANIHASLHCVVENQVAMGEKMNVSSTLNRLMEDGLSRHDAIHAIASVLAEHLHEMMSGTPAAFGEDKYTADLDALTIEKWKTYAQE